MDNTASGSRATVPGGQANAARGDFSFAAGYRAKANHDGAVVISANSLAVTSDSIASGASEQFVLRADGHFYLTDMAGTATIPAGRFLNTSTGAYLSTGGTWTNSSDKHSKENFETVDETALLGKLAELEITEWNYIVDGDEIKHIGPVSQDFYKLFQLGNDDKGISTVDASGIALAAIQALYQENQGLKDRMRKLEEQVKRLTD